MITISVTVNGKEYTTEVSDETFEQLRDGAALRKRPVKWYLLMVLMDYGWELTEEKILKYMDEKWVL